MSDKPLEVNQAASCKLARKLFDRVGNWEPGEFLELAELLTRLRIALWKGGLKERLLRMPSEVSGRYGTPAYFATLHLARTHHYVPGADQSTFAKCLEDECMLYVEPKRGWPDKPPKRLLKRPRKLDEEYLLGMKAQWLRMGRELLSPAYLGHGRVEMPGKTKPLRITGQIRISTLEYLVTHRNVSTCELMDCSSNPSKTVAELRELFDGALAPYIQRPGKKNKSDGYSTEIVDSREKK